VLDGAVIPGFQTPVEIFGIDFVKSIADTQLHDM
jgi:hypothetical protein